MNDRLHAPCLGHSAVIADLTNEVLLPYRTGLHQPSWFLKLFCFFKFPWTAKEYIKSALHNLHLLSSDPALPISCQKFRMCLLDARDIPWSLSRLGSAITCLQENLWESRVKVERSSSKYFEMFVRSERSSNQPLDHQQATAMDFTTDKRRLPNLVHGHLAMCKACAHQWTYCFLDSRGGWKFLFITGGRALAILSAPPGFLGQAKTIAG